MARAREQFQCDPSISIWLPQIDEADVKPLSKKNILMFLIRFCTESTNAGTIDRPTLLDQFNAQVKDRPASLKSEAITNTRLGQLLKALTNDGALNKVKDQSRGLVIYEVKKDLSGFLLNNAQANKTSNNKPKRTAVEARAEAAAMREIFINHPKVELLDTKPLSYYHFRLLNGVLDSALRTSKHDNRSTIPLRYPLIFNTIDGPRKEWIGIQSSCRTTADSQIMEMSDMGCVACINSLYVAHLSKKYSNNIPPTEEIPNKYIFDIYDLCSEMGKHRKSAPEVVKRLRRMRDTVFKIDAKDAPYFKEAFGYLGDLVEFQYLTHFEIVTETVVQSLVTDGERGSAEVLLKEDVGSGDLFKDDIEVMYDIARRQTVISMPRFYVVSFDAHMHHALIEEYKAHRFSVNPAIVQELGEGIVQRFYSWSKAYIGTSSSRKEAKWFLTNELREHMMPGSTDQTFSRELTTMAKKYLVDSSGNKLTTEHWNPEGKNLSLVFGFYIITDYSKEAIAKHIKMSRALQSIRGPKPKLLALHGIYRDKNDVYVGDKSFHNTRLAEERKAAIRGNR